MRKLITACVLAAFIATAFVGCTKSISHIKTRKPAANEEPSITKVTDEMDKELENKLKAIDDMGKDVIDNIRTEASKAVSEIRELIPTTITTAPLPEPKEIELNVESKSDLGTLGFRSVKIDYENKLLIIKIEPSDKSKRIKYASADKNGVELETAYNANTIWISGAEQIENLSQITIIYTVENSNPVTVTFDIPV
jgi:hypothetical protein